MLRRLACLVWLLSMSAHAQERDLRLPAEFEALSDRGLGLNNMATAGLQGPGSIRVNPSLLALEREYSVSASYNWTPTGRDFYQLGVVDGSTANFAAGLLYTGFQDSYEHGAFLMQRDSPVLKRASLGLAYPLAKFAIGMSGNYVETRLDEGFESRVVKSVALGGGMVAFLNPSLRIGAAVENLNNRRIQTVAPTTYRIGLDWAPFGEDAHFYFDYRHRQRVTELEGPVSAIPGLPLDPSELAGFSDPERMLFAGALLRIYGVVRATASYGHALSSDDRRSLAASIGLQQQGFSISYSIARPYLDRSEQLNSLSLTMLLNI